MTGTIEFVLAEDVGSLPARLRGGVVAIGNFDGVHRGHQAVLGAALDKARDAGVPAIALTFEPHPRTFFQPNVPLPRITQPAMKARLLRLLGFDAVVQLPFTAGFAAQTADAFIADVLVAGLGLSEVVTGFDFHFGAKRQGTPAFLAAAGQSHGFGVTCVDAFCDEGGGAISSSRIREMLAAGDAVSAAGLLGYRYTAEAEVVHGKALGRTLGYPTANMVLPEPAVLGQGIYAVRLRRQDGTLHDGVASFGRRPTVDADGAPLLETFVFDFTGDLYWEICQVSFFGHLRGEEKFDSLDALLDQMKRDEAEARALLAGVGPISEMDRRLCF
ncbi:MAG: bifunctional riboflavin kinase/FAD synthetase [Rhizobiaceae bacterium]|nr:bifunctional riboflavin kinase/FAD synthetase [Rhizobiaceae bacterium]